jgi:hypothetical protein
MQESNRKQPRRDQKSTHNGVLLDFYSRHLSWPAFASPKISSPAGHFVPP